MGSVPLYPVDKLMIKGTKTKQMVKRTLTSSCLIQCLVAIACDQLLGITRPSNCKLLFVLLKEEEK